MKVSEHSLKEYPPPPLHFTKTTYFPQRRMFREGRKTFRKNSQVFRIINLIRISELCRIIIHILHKKRTNSSTITKLESTRDILLKRNSPPLSYPQCYDHHWVGTIYKPTLLFWEYNLKPVHIKLIQFKNKTKNTYTLSKCYTGEQILIRQNIIQANCYTG